MMEAVACAKLIDLPLVAHLTIHWAFTDVGDDPDGKLFAKLREGTRQVGASARFSPSPGIWARERMSGGQGEVVHCHLLFHLPVQFRSGKGLREVKAAIYRLINRHGRTDGDECGDGYWADNVIKLVIHHNPDGKYLIKGGGPEVWEALRCTQKGSTFSRASFTASDAARTGEHRSCRAWAAGIERSKREGAYCHRFDRLSCV